LGLALLASGLEVTALAAILAAVAGTLWGIGSWDRIRRQSEAGILRGALAGLLLGGASVALYKLAAVTGGKGLFAWLFMGLAVGSAAFISLRLLWAAEDWVDQQPTHWLKRYRKGSWQHQYQALKEKLQQVRQSLDQARYRQEQVEAEAERPGRSAERLGRAVEAWKLRREVLTKEAERLELALFIIDLKRWGNGLLAFVEVQGGDDEGQAAFQEHLERGKAILEAAPAPLSQKLEPWVHGMIEEWLQLLATDALQSCSPFADDSLREWVESLLEQLEAEVPVEREDDLQSELTRLTAELEAAQEVEQLVVRGG
jgi:hypothetical protein